MHTGQKYFWRSGVVWRLLAAVCWLLAASPVSLAASPALAERSAGGAPLDRDRAGFLFPGWLKPDLVDLRPARQLVVHLAGLECTCQPGIARDDLHRYHPNAAWRCLTT